MKFITFCLLFVVSSGPAVVLGKTASTGSPLVLATTRHSVSTSAGNTFNLDDYGAIHDGVTDDGPALQSALDAIAESGGGTLFVPAGRYAIVTPVQKDFTGLADSVTILGVESLTPVPPPNSEGFVLTHGLDLVSEFAPRTGEQGISIQIAGLQSFLIKDITFIGTPGVTTDAVVTLELINIREATIRHCEFYCLSSTVVGGAIVLSVRSALHLEQSVFLGSTGNSALDNSVVQNTEWTGVAIAESIFADWGQRPELYSKLGFSTPYSWINIGNAAALTGDSPRREVAIRDAFLDEGGFFGLSSQPDSTSAPIDLVYVSGLYMNVSNLGTTGHYFDGLKNVLIERSHYGYTQNADSAIHLLRVGNAILDQVECVDSANRIRAEADTGKLTVINSVYTYLDSQSPVTKVITTETPDDDAVQYVRGQFSETLGRAPDPAAHFYWSNQILECGDVLQCVNSAKAALDSYLAVTPSERFAVSGLMVDETGTGLPNVTVALSGSQNVSVETDADGRYQFSNLPTSGVYFITTSRPHYTFNPVTYEIATPAGDHSFNSAATLNRHDVRGVVADETGQPLSDCAVRLSGSVTTTTTTDANGQYAFNDLAAGGNYTVTPQKTSYAFSPVSRILSDLGSDQNANFEAVPKSVIGFSAASYSGSEEARRITVTVNRTGDVSTAADLVYSAIDGSALQRSDVIPVIGRLTFEPGETVKTFIVFITDDAYIEGDETLTLELGDIEGSTLGNNNSAVLTITDNDTHPAANPIDDPQFFVRQHYRDFLNRSADPAGLAFWSNQLVSCGSDAVCIADRRMNVSAAFFLSIEFQQTGFLAYRVYEASFARPPQHLEEFLLDTRTIGAGVVVNAEGWQELLEENKTEFIAGFVVQTRFTEQYPLTLTPAEFVNQLNANTGDALSPDAVASAVSEFQGAATSDSPAARARALRRVAENETFSQRELNPAFVLMQYFGYLQRNPDEAPDHNLDGYTFWLHKLEEFNGDFRRAEMVKSFLVSAEYRARFGTP